MNIRYCFIITIFFLTSFSLCAQQRGMQPVQVNIEGTATTLYQQSHALLIGVSSYNNGLKKLPGVAADIQAVKTTLEDNDFDVTIVMDPDNYGLTNAFNDFIARYGQLKDNRLIFYFAGHGYTRKIYDNEIGYLLPVNCPNPDTDPAGFQQRAMPMGQIELFAQQIESKHALFLFDACFSGAVFAQSRDIPGIINYKTTQPVRQFITSGSADETVPDQSIFRRQFISGLSGEADLNMDNFITGTELGDFLQTTVVNYSRNALHPQYGKIRDSKLDKGDFVFVMDKSITPMIPAVTPSIEEERTLVQYGKLELTAQISGALYVDGTFMKQVSAGNILTLKDLTEGDHTIKISGDETVEKSVLINANQTAYLTIEKKRTDTAGIPAMVFIQGGTFQMGSNDGEDDEQPVHSVTLSSFYLGKYEITVSQFMQFINETGYQTDADKDGGGYIWSGSEWKKSSGVNWKCDAEGNIRSQSEYNHPVIQISWNDATEYCNWLSRKTGKSYRLPTEAEWEFAAGNGSKHTKYSWGNGEPFGKNGGNVADETAKRKFGLSNIWSGYDDGFASTSPVGSFNPNELGLYDMTGNVYEWCSDWYGSDYYKSSISSNPKGPMAGSNRVKRGGSWSYLPAFQRVASRDYSSQSNNLYMHGFRIARTE